MASTSNEQFEYSFEDIDLERVEVPEIDAAVLIERLEDPQAMIAEDDDMLECVIRSLEAEVESCKAGAMTPVNFDAHDGCEGLEETLSELHSHDLSRSPYELDDPFDWEMEVLPESPCSDMEGWYMDSCLKAAAMVVYGDPLDYASLCYGECSMEQEYSPLWE